MTKEEHKLFIMDLCARIPYQPYAEITFGKKKYTKRFKSTDIFGPPSTVRKKYEAKLYLRPLTSLTKEERQEIGVVIQKDCPAPYGEIKPDGVDNLLLASTIGATNLIDWFNANHFDYRGLIGKGLALEAPRGMYDNSNKEQL